MATAEEICNLALSHIGSGAEIANLVTEKSAEARALNRFYDTARDKTLRDFPWPFATKNIALALVAEKPTPEWLYSYRYPTDCLYFRRILNVPVFVPPVGIPAITYPIAVRDTNTTYVPYMLSQDTQGELVYTNIKKAQAEYTVRSIDPTRYPSDFVTAFSWLLAGYVAPRLSKGDPMQLADRSFKAYEVELAEARRAAGNEERPLMAPDAEWTRFRN